MRHSSRRLFRLDDTYIPFVWRLLFTRGVGEKKKGTGSQVAALPKSTRIGRGEFHADLDWWKRALHQPFFAEGVSLYSPVLNV